ncbi:ATP-grasp domain-containing protein [Streptomyces kroppenstedtii]|uniref:ATP-grasp domain-containing protein n=1 Tax=Streptomyces kroppenstedtii TaxID=3051181 RepID=UPI0028D20728|nr:ATP-grasp domain-containing protein [Streptomyces sp. DSM 40484]
MSARPSPAYAARATRPATRAAVVDADGMGAFLPGALAREGVRSVLVRSDAPNPHLANHPDLTDLAPEVTHRGEVAATADALRRYGVDRVVAGAESGVLLADALSAELGTPGHGMSRPSARRDKYEMACAVRESGQATADCLATDSADEVVAWARGHGRWPVVLKPLASAGTDNVLFCRSTAQLRAGVAAITAGRDRYGGRNLAVLVQEHLAGEEYFVNTVSSGGVHHVVEVWRYHKRPVGDRPMYDHEEPVPPDEPVVGELTAYTLRVLDALEIRNGAAHTEVIRTGRGPVLVECAARHGGSHTPSVVSRFLGTDQLACLARAVARPDQAALGRLPRYRPRAHLRYVTLLSPRAGGPLSAERFARVRALGTFVEMALTMPEGTVLPRTRDLASSPGFVYLASADPARVAADHRRLRALEHGDLYGPATTTTPPGERYGDR